MAININVSVYYDGTDITNEVISYDRSKTACTGVGMLRLETTRNVNPTIYRTVELYEGGNKKGTYFIHSIEKNMPKNSMNINCQDASLKLQEYFVAENYIIDYPSNSGYWIKKFLTEATIGYSFTGSDVGSLLSNNTTLGMASCADVITPLLQQNGWYITFNANNTAIIGKISLDFDSYDYSFDDDTILDLSVSDNDKIFRNRVVVWGTGNPTTGRWVYADLNRAGQFSNEYDSNDVRTVVVSNSNIKDNTAAYSIANQALTEFSRILPQLEVQLAGYSNLDIGSRIEINYGGSTWEGMVTTVSSSLSSNGLTTSFVLNERCPRLFAYYDFGGFVYVGTNGNGIWRKPLENSSTWTNFSTGLTDLNIKDLAIRDNVYAAIGDGGTLFTRPWGATAWQAFTPSFDDGETVYPLTSGKAVACAFDKSTGHIIAGYTLNSGGPYRSWIYDISPAGVSTRTQFVDEEYVADYTLVDVDSNGTNIFATVALSASGEIMLWEGAYSPGYTSQGYYPHGNTLSGLAIAFSGVWEYATPVPIVEPAFSRGIYGDGKYVMNSLQYTGQEITGREIYTPGSGISQQHFFDLDFADVYTTAPMGNRSVIGAGWDSAESINKLETYNLETNEHTFKTLTELGSDFIMSAMVIAPSNSTPCYYILSANDSTSIFSLYRYDIMHDRLVRLAISSYPATTIYGGNSPLTVQYDTTMIHSDNKLIYNIGLYYFTATVGSYVGNIIIPTVIMFDMTLNILHVYQNPYALNEDDPTPDARVFAALDGEAYSIIFEGWGDLTDHIYKTRTNGTIDIIDAGTAGQRYNTFVGNETSLYAVRSSNAAFFNCKTQQIEYTVSQATTNVLFARQLSEEGNTIYYDRRDGDLYSHDIIGSGLGNFKLETNYLPDTADGYTMNMQDSTCALVLDSIYLDLVTRNFFGSDQYEKYKQKIFVPASGRVMSRDYTRYGSNDYFLMRDNPNGTFSMVKDIQYPYQLEISNTTPVVAYATTSYSGLLISGIQTGFSQGNIYVSPAGAENTYSRVILDALDSNVPDIRSFTSFFGSGEAVDRGTFIFLPQGNAAFIDQITETDICAINVADIYAAGGYTISGVLGSGTIIVDTLPGYINHVETTNNFDYQYFFASKSGIPTVFYQRDAFIVDELPNVFVDQTYNLSENYQITIIRCDDLL